ncbi:MAG: isocitrate lyase/PEP mutase family protein [Thermoplasmata archaeon]|jgi:2-methylisocitrate lyase-like PEP mutase family enzyme
MTGSMRPTLRSRLTSGPIVVAPGAYDALSARLVEEAGFPAVYVSGAGASYSLLGAPDVGLISFVEMRDQVRRIAQAVSIPVIADGDTGHGNALNVQRTVREFEAAGANAIQIEDQTFPKSCGHLNEKTVVPVEEMVGKLRAAVEARSSSEFLIIARTDALLPEGTDAALDRLKAYASVGADVLFLEAPPDLATMRRACAELPRPEMANMVEGGKTPLLSASELEKIGYRLVIFPGAGARIAAFALRELYATLAREGTTASLLGRMLLFDELNRVVGLPEIRRAGERFGGTTPVRRSP